MKWVENGDAKVEFICSNVKKNVFLIGDSIRKGYCDTVREELKNEAEVFYVSDNCRSSQYIIFSLKKWAAMFDCAECVDIVHFNCGQWDTAHWNGYKYSLTSEEEYRKNIEMIIYLLREFFPNAEIIFATTSRMNPEGGSIGGVNPRSDKEVNRYNEIAVCVAQDNDVKINDINAFMHDFGSECFNDTCHLTSEAFERLGKYVASELKKYF